MSQATRKPILCLAASALLALSAVALAADEAREDIPITDPALLESLGFPPDATNVYATPRAFEELMMDPAERAARRQAQLAEEENAAEESSPAGGPYGTATAGFSTVYFTEFQPREPDARFTTGNQDYLWCEVEGTDICQGNAQFTDLPHGAKLENVRYWYYDNDDSSDLRDLVMFLLRVCNPPSGGGESVFTVLASVESEGAPGYASSFAGGLEENIDLRECVYRTNFFSEIGNAGLDLGFQKARVQWRRQVSPAPSTATFNDVPPGHPFFQHIEALAEIGRAHV